MYLWFSCPGLISEHTQASITKSLFLNVPNLPVISRLFSFPLLVFFFNVGFFTLYHSHCFFSECLSPSSSFYLSGSLSPSLSLSHPESLQTVALSEEADRKESTASHGSLSCLKIGKQKLLYRLAGSVWFTTVMSVGFVRSLTWRVTRIFSGENTHIPRMPVHVFGAKFACLQLVYFCTNMSVRLIPRHRLGSKRSIWGITRGSKG